MPVVLTLKPEVVVTTKGDPVATVGLCVVVCAPDSTCCAQAPDTGSATVVGSALTGAPAVSPDGSIYIGSTDRSLYAFASDGTF